MTKWSDSSQVLPSLSPGLPCELAPFDSHEENAKGNWTHCKWSRSPGPAGTIWNTQLGDSVSHMLIS